MERNTNKEIPIFFSIDNSYAPFLAVAINSLIKNSSSERKYKAIVLYSELSHENKKKISSLASEKENIEVEFKKISEGMEAITDRMSNRLRCDYFTLTIYFRLFIPTLFPEYDKGIYIDSDVVLNGDIAELYDTDIGDNLIGACSDLSVQKIPELVSYMENAVGVKKEEYINSGVLLMNLAALREANLDSHFLYLLTKYHFDCIAPDQDYINALCNGKIYYLSSIWDSMPDEGESENEEAKLIHYNLFSKPWCYDGIMYEKLFWNYAKDSGYLSEIKKYKENYSEEQKVRDSESLSLLISRGKSISESEKTFKRLYDGGEKIRL